jgi:hypothetical protein
MDYSGCRRRLRLVRGEVRTGFGQFFVHPLVRRIPVGSFFAHRRFILSGDGGPSLDDLGFDLLNRPIAGFELVK